MGEQLQSPSQLKSPMSLSLTVRSRGGKPSKRFPLQLSLAGPSASVGDLKAELTKAAKISTSRQRLTTTDKKVLDDDDKSMSDYGLKDGDTVEVKDLGPQISWKLVFLIEYLGPLLIHPALYYGGNFLYRQDFEHSRMQSTAFALVVAHFLKRELETLFVHRFSSATMPFFNVFKNSAHYWGLSGTLIAVPLYGPWLGQKALQGSVRESDKWIYGWVALWAYAELSNLITHLKLRALRPAGTRTRQIPQGYGFTLVSCGNYLYESLAWIAFTGMTLHWSAALFTAVSTGQMLIWAAKKHQRYKKEFGKAYPKGRKAMIPFLF